MAMAYEERQNGAGGFEKSVAVKLIWEAYCEAPDFRNNFFAETQLVADPIYFQLASLLLKSWMAITDSLRSIITLPFKISWNYPFTTTRQSLTRCTKT